MENPLGQRLRDLPGPLLLTGHTGFKGTWMTFFLEHLSVPVVGYSLHPEKDSFYRRAERTGAIPETFADIRDSEAFEKFIDLHRPSTIIHMAAQPLVLKSYECPRETFDVNVMGTVNVLDIAFKKDYVKAILVVTTDKVYRNDNSGRAFVESDPLEGKDPYSASKVGTEAVVAAWQHISKVTSGPRIVSARAGNIIGGGDLSKDRLMPDLIREFYFKDITPIRNPKSVRPWQHVMEVCVAYISILEQICTREFHSAINIGPKKPSLAVHEVYQIVAGRFNAKTFINGKSRIIKHQKSAFEMELLELDSSKINRDLLWEPIFTQSEAIEDVLNWWDSVVLRGESASSVTLTSISDYLARIENNDNAK